MQEGTSFNISKFTSRHSMISTLLEDAALACIHVQAGRHRLSTIGTHSQTKPQPHVSCPWLPMCQVCH